MNMFWIILTGIATLVYVFFLGRSKSWMCRLRLTLIPVSLAMSIVFIFFYIIGSYKTLEAQKFGYQFMLLLPLSIEYILLCSVVVCWSAWKKRGFTKLKKKKGLIKEIIYGLIIGNIIAFLFGIILSFIDDLVPFLGLLVGLGYALIVVIILGLKEEFKIEPSIKTPKKKSESKKPVEK